MATNYSFERGKYGVFPGTIVAFPRSLQGDDPNGSDFRNRIPAGFLRCDGSILNGVDYPNLKRILGVGANSKFRKAEATLEEDVALNVSGGQFQLPDLGSKFIQANSSSGVYTGDTIVSPNDVVTQKVGIGVDLNLNLGTSVDISYSGEFSIPQQTISFLNNQNFGTTLGVVTDEINVNDSSYLMHGHYSNLPVYAFENPGENQSTDMSIGSADPSPSLSSINSVPIVGQVSEVAGEQENATHLHTVTRTFPAKSINSSVDAFTADGFNVTTTVTLAEANTFKMDDLVPRYILVEYLIKF
jgi:hypothetical protein